MRSLRIEKVENIPDSITPDTVYYVKQGNGFDIWMTDKDGIEMLPHNGNEVKTLPESPPPP